MASVFIGVWWEGLDAFEVADLAAARREVHFAGAAGERVAVDVPAEDCAGREEDGDPDGSFGKGEEVVERGVHCVMWVKKWGMVGGRSVLPRSKRIGMSTDRNKIAMELSASDLQDFLDRCWKEKGLTLKRVQELAAEYGINVSLMGARTFRETTFARHLQRISKAAELAEQVAAMRKAGAGHTIADAAAAIISDEVLDKLVNRDGDEEIDLDVMSKIVKRLRDSDSRTRALEHKIEQDKQTAVEKILNDPKLLAEVAKIKANSGLSDREKIAAIQRRLWGERPADFVPHRATGAMIDKGE